MKFLVLTWFIKIREEPTLGVNKITKSVTLVGFVISFNMFMNDPAINKLIADLTAGNDITSA